MSPVTAAQRAGLDWKALSKEERAIVTKITRTLNALHEEQITGWLGRNLALQDTIVALRGQLP